MPVRRALLALPLLAAACGPSDDERRRAFIHFLRTRSTGPPRDYANSISQFDRRVLGPYAAQWDVIADFHEARARRQDAMTVASQSLNRFPPMPMVAGPPTFLVMEIEQLAGLRDALRGYQEAVRAARDALPREAARAETRRAALQQPPDLAAAYEAAHERMVRAWVRVHEPALSALEAAVGGDVRLAETFLAHPDRVRASADAAVMPDAAVQARLEAALQEGRALADAHREADERRQAYRRGP